MPKTPPKFRSISQIDVPQGRRGKHHEIILQFLRDLEDLEDDRALKVPLSELPDSKANIRSALNRATRQQKVSIATSSDDKYLYVWKTSNKK